MASRPIISYDDITLPYEPVDDSTVNNQPPPAKKRKSNNQKGKQHQQRQRHWDDPGKNEPIGYDTRQGYAEGKEVEMKCEEEEESRELTHEEIWDDSALIEAWNSAMEEYKAYNGPDKGWKKEPVHKSPLRWYNVPQETKLNKASTSTAAKAESSSGAMATAEQAAEENTQPLNFDTFVPTHDPSLNPEGAHLISTSENYVPQEGVGAMVSRDEAFKHALNATYWAGYWTAIYYCQGSSSQKRPADEEAKNVVEEDGDEGIEATDEEVEVEEEFVSTQR